MIDIVLATFNGERYLAEQVKSIQRNHVYSEQVARLIIVDDGSTDKTQEIVRLLALTDPKIEWVSNNSKLHGPSNNFSFGLSLTTAEYIMLSDQDDVWLPEKIAVSLSQLQSLAKTSTDLPQLVFSDKLIVDAKLNLISKSYFSLKSISLDWHLKFEQLCQQNVASGCTMLFNRALLVKALPIPAKSYMHDWWLILVASRCGKIKLIKQPLIQYRQHENNSIGAKKISKWRLISEFYSHLHKFEQSFLKTSLQAQAFKKFEENEKIAENYTINALANIQHYDRIKRVKLLLKKTITRSHLFGKIALLIVLLKMKVTAKQY